MITGDLDRVLATEISSAGTWRPGPPGGPTGPGRYASSVPFLLARAHQGEPVSIAAGLAARLAPLDWVQAAAVTGGGYLSVTVTPDALAALAVRVPAAGPACARSSALRGVAVTAPGGDGLATARTWAQARDRLARHLTGVLAEAAGASVTWIPADERAAPGKLPPRGATAVTGAARQAVPGGPWPGRVPQPAGTAERAGPGEPPPTRASPVAEAIAYAGTGPVRFALCRLPPGGPLGLEPRAVAAHHLRNPAYAVRYAHAHAASAQRQAADLGLARGEAAGFQPRLLAHPSEQALLDALSWLPERVAGAARRGQPDVLARYLETLAGSYFGCQERCPAVPPGARADGPAASARLWLAEAARTALAAGLGLLGVDAPDRL